MSTLSFNDSCDFCKEAESGYLTKIADARILPRKRTIYETENFRVFPTLGPLVEGHLLIASKQHYVGIAGLAENLYDELEEVQELVRRKVTEKYQAPVFFEHGDVTEARGSGSCISHTHLHVVPVGVDIIEGLEMKFNKREIKKYAELKENQDAQIPYMFVQTREGRRYVFDIPGVLPSQYARQVVAIKIGKPERWNWKTRTTTDLRKGLRETMQTFYALNEDPFERWLGKDNWMRQYFDFPNCIHDAMTGERHDKIQWLNIHAESVEEAIKMRGEITAKELGRMFAGDFCGDGDDMIGNKPIGSMLANKIAKWSAMHGRIVIEYSKGKKPQECKWEEKRYRIKE